MLLELARLRKAERDLSFTAHWTPALLPYLSASQHQAIVKRFDDAYSTTCAGVWILSTIVTFVTLTALAMISAERAKDSSENKPLALYAAILGVLIFIMIVTRLLRLRGKARVNDLVRQLNAEFDGLVFEKRTEDRPNGCLKRLWNSEGDTQIIIYVDKSDDELQEYSLGQLAIVQISPDDYISITIPPPSYSESHTDPDPVQHLQPTHG
ncbi:hypothetical protein EDD86DRAFT_246257 [Gorgonomyces haynaldii]|nr:hypothetical protein EDD86DRAFT_246257 [Gorgonomyces haynaldii]